LQEIFFMLYITRHIQHALQYARMKQLDLSISEGIEGIIESRGRYGSLRENSENLSPALMLCEQIAIDSMPILFLVVHVKAKGKISGKNNRQVNRQVSRCRQIFRYP
jgi:hypothetical protein